MSSISDLFYLKTASTNNTRCGGISKEYVDGMLNMLLRFNRVTLAIYYHSVTRGKTPLVLRYDGIELLSTWLDPCWQQQVCRLVEKCLKLTSTETVFTSFSNRLKCGHLLQTMPVFILIYLCASTLLLPIYIVNTLLSLNVLLRHLRTQIYRLHKSCWNWVRQIIHSISDPVYQVLYLLVHQYIVLTV